MKINISTEFLTAKNYLIIKGFVELGGNTPDAYEAQKHKLIELINNGSIDRLKKTAGSENVYTLFCNTCVLDEQTGGYICGNDIACENINNIPAKDGYDIIHLEPLEYAIFDCFFDHELTMVQTLKKIDDIYWGEWLKENPYESMIETNTGANTPGIAVIGLIDPLDPNADCFHIKNWYPIRQKN
jgi:hypothetical protein